jgi:hypothetical protein
LTGSECPQHNVRPPMLPAGASHQQPGTHLILPSTLVLPGFLPSMSRFGSVLPIFFSPYTCTCS